MKNFLISILISILILLTCFACVEQEQELVLDGWWCHPTETLCLKIEGRFVNVFIYDDDMCKRAFGSNILFCQDEETGEPDRACGYIVDTRGDHVRYDLTNDGLHISESTLNVFNETFVSSDAPHNCERSN